MTIEKGPYYWSCHITLVRACSAKINIQRRAVAEASRNLAIGIRLQEMRFANDRWRNAKPHAYRMPLAGSAVVVRRVSEDLEVLQYLVRVRQVVKKLGGAYD